MLFQVIDDAIGSHFEHAFTEHVTPERRRELVLELRTYFKLQSFKEGQVVWRPGDVARALFLLTHGRMSSFHDRLTTSETPTLIEALRPGAIIGYLSSFSRAAHGRLLIAGDPPSSREPIDENLQASPQFCRRRRRADTPEYAAHGLLLHIESYERMRVENPSLAHAFMLAAIGRSCIEYEHHCKLVGIAL